MEAEVAQLLSGLGVPASAVAFWYYIHTKDKRHAAERRQWKESIEKMHDKQDTKAEEHLKVLTEIATLLKTQR